MRRHDVHPRPTGTYALFRRRLHVGMARMHEDMHRAPASGDPDRDFLAMMIPHHAGAIAMAELVLIHGRDPLVREFAQRILSGQQAEIVAMQGRIAGLDLHAEAYPALTGLRGG